MRVLGLGMEQNLFQEKDKKAIVLFAKKYAKQNGYVRTGWACNEAYKNAKSWKDDAHEAAYVNSISSLIIASPDYVRDKSDHKKDWDIRFVERTFSQRNPEIWELIKHPINIITGLLIGFVIGYFTKCSGQSNNQPTPKTESVQSLDTSANKH